MHYSIPVAKPQIWAVKNLANDFLIKAAIAASLPPQMSFKNRQLDILEFCIDKEGSKTILFLGQTIGKLLISASLDLTLISCNFCL